ncbi:hypothetical protein SLEP1_g56124 [Rubroshorea leprosula]|uniref:Uncharacterized protein n=1 Tax=Rubroshorea leprosula TaxID=152421 RepID=A0AAV5MHV9_9ROSI|nr:hypothetical protein SLEP1_g56124 [Rubroshorea leprosula]
MFATFCFCLLYQTCTYFKLQRKSQDPGSFCGLQPLWQGLIEKITKVILLGGK